MNRKHLQQLPSVLGPAALDLFWPDQLWTELNSEEATNSTTNQNAQLAKNLLMA